MAEIESSYREGLITYGERYNKVIDIWAAASEEIADAMMMASDEDRLHPTAVKHASSLPLTRSS